MPSGLDLYRLFLIFVRTLALFLVAPIFASRSIPSMVKIGLAALLSMLILPTLDTAAPLPWPGAEGTLANWPTDWLLVLLTVGQEILVGVIIGFVSNLVFLTIGMAASIMGVQVGFRAASLFDPMTSASTSALDQFYSFLAIALFLAINGHHWLLLGLSRSFEVTPLGTFVFQPVTVERLVFLTGETFVAAVRIALPVMGALLLTDLGMGVVARAVPQIQVFFLGLPIKEGFGIAAIGMTLVLTMPYIKKLMGSFVANMLAVVHP